jgi:hypothetical protein
MATGIPSVARRRCGWLRGPSSLGVGRRPAEHHVVEIAVIVALELDELLAPGVGAGDAQRVHVGLGAGVGEAHLVHAGHAREAFGQLDLDRRGGGEKHAVLDRFGDAAVDLRVRVPQNDRAEAEAIVDEAVVVGVPDIRAGAARMIGVSSSPQ